MPNNSMESKEEKKYQIHYISSDLHLGAILRIKKFVNGKKELDDIVYLPHDRGNDDTGRGRYLLIENGTLSEHMETGPMTMLDFEEEENKEEDNA